MRRRELIAGLFALTAGACARPAARAAPPIAPTAPIPEQDAWNAEARAIVLSGLESLCVFDQYAAFRSANVKRAEGQPPGAPAREPPSPSAWQAATARVYALPGRAATLAAAISRATPDPALWRARRAAAEAATQLSAAAETLVAYRRRIDQFAPDDDGSSIAPLRSRARADWVDAAQAWGVPAPPPAGACG